MKKIIESFVVSIIGLFILVPQAYAVGLLQSKISYYTAYTPSFARSSTPFTTGVTTQSANSNGSVTVNISNATEYADSGFVIYDGKLGDFTSLTLYGTGDQFGLNFWFDTNNDNEYFTWNSNGVLTGLAGDTYGLGPSSSGGVLNVDNSSQFGMMTGSYGPFTIAQLKSGSFTGITTDTHIAIWVGINTSSGSKTTTINYPPGACLSTGFHRDNIDLTAALINPSGILSGDIDATGCNIGVYYGPGSTGTVDGAQVHGANYYGIVNRKGSVSITDSNIHDIGEYPFNGTQHGVGIYYANVIGATNGDCDDSNGATTGTIDGNTVSAYQKGGIVVNCSKSNVTTSNNIVTGLGPVPFIAQNGIQYGYLATGSILDNVITGNYYTGDTWQSAGVLLYNIHPNEINRKHNVVDGNQAGQLMGNANAAWMQ